MNRSLAGLLVLVLTLVALTGCGQGTSGGPGVTNPPQQQPVFGEADNTFNLSTHMMPTTLHRGETKEIAFLIRGVQES
ncbi:hypothetical protein P12x_000161 [Tundrisphaera lichenicola]|uniref:hypothetical protein n=1 Tax=Tundrisphaera lichenicola TaxID=2029860 RepID=UPI003EB6BB18